MAARPVAAFVGIISLILTPLVFSQSDHADASRKWPTVASINLCADQLIMLLAKPEQIKSLSNLSHQSAGSYYFKQARDYLSNEGHAEQILPLDPDIVLAGEYSSVHTLKMLRELGLRVETIPVASDIATLFENIRQVAIWLGHAAQGDSIVQRLQQRLDALHPISDDRPVAAVYDPNGFTVGVNTLRGQMIELAGWANAASQAGIETYGKLSLEALIRLSPVALIESPYSPDTWSRGQAVREHPALRQAGLAPLLINVPSRMTICAGPWTLDVIEQLQTQRLRLSARP